MAGVVQVTFTFSGLAKRARVASGASLASARRRAQQLYAGVRGPSGLVDATAVFFVRGEAVEDDAAWLAELAHAASAGGGELGVELREPGRADEVLTRQLGIGSVSRKWERVERRFVKFSSRLKLDCEATAEVAAEVQIKEDIFLADQDQETFVRIALNGIISSLSISRVPINLIIVVDYSGSMRGDKIAAARAAAKAAVDTLQSGDQVTVIAFSSVAETLVPTTILGQGDVDGAMRALDEMEARGTTNMRTALEAAAQGAIRAFSGSRTNRVILLTDGKPQKEDGLVDIVGQLAHAGICTTTLGIGDDFNESLLERLASVGTGSLYFVKHGDEMVRVMREEIADLSLVVGRQCRVVITPQPKVSVTEVYGYPSGNESNGQTVIQVGDVRSNATLDILVRLAYNLPPGEHKLLSVVVTYVDVNTSKQESTATLAASFTENEAELMSNVPVGLVVEKAAKMHAARVMRDAIDLFRGGDYAEGMALLEMFSDSVVKDLRKEGDIGPTSAETIDGLAKEVRAMARRAGRTSKGAAARRASLAPSGVDTEMRQMARKMLTRASELERM